MTPIPPPLGQVQPGELYVDLATRQLWLGVAESVTEDRAVLISNIEGADDIAAETLAAANANTAAVAATKSNVGHKHVAEDITDFAVEVEKVIVASPTAGGFERGMVVMWSGLLADIGVGPLAGWALCDGNNGTPNLRDKFVVGAGNKPPGAGPIAAGITIGGGTHIHTINPTQLTVEHLPAHNHGGLTTPENVNHTHSVYIATDAQGQHQHLGLTVAGSNSDSAENGPLISSNNSGSIGPQSSPGSSTAFAGIHSHLVQGNTGGPNVNHVHGIPAVGGDQGHAHTIVGGGGIHEHTVTAAQMREGLPYLALAYIMKL